jgi:diaminohydroxyphosphoribosylaminopyrimidine deaminase/5-amino-6-(5-phosphoribosylamino)uracil reductase
MRLALSLARRADPSPNPPVGAVVVVRHVVVGIGWHESAGGPHAEVAALTAAGDAAREGTLYVTLEPCNHHGRTPPCVDAVLAAGVRRVVLGCLDPNPHVAGGGAARLHERGVAVAIGVLGDAADALIRRWTRQLIGRAGPGSCAASLRAGPRTPRSPV